MKKTLHTILLLIPFLSFGQIVKIGRSEKKDANVYQIDSLKFSGVLLNNGWKYIYGDKSEFATPNFDDSKWKKGNIDDEFDKFASVDKNTIGWFRKKIKIGDSLVNKPLIFSINIKGAAEIFLDGKLIHTIGRLPKGKRKELLNFFKEPIPYSVNFSSAGEHTLAVRFVFCHTNQFFDRYDYFPLSIRLRGIDGYVQSVYSDSSGVKMTGGIAVGFFLMMAFIHYTFFRFFRSKKYNLPFFVAMLLFGINFYLSVADPYITTSKPFFLGQQLSKDLSFIIGHIILLYAVYDFLQYPRKILFSIAVILVVLSRIIGFFEIIDDSTPKIFMYAGLLINYIYLIWKAIKNKNADGKVLRNAVFWFLWVIAILIVILIVVAIFVSISYGPGAQFLNEILTTYWLPLFVNTFTVGPQLAISGAISMSLAKDFVKTNITLKQKLEEVEALSAEKQDILATQNELLEKQVNERTEELRKSLEELRETQDQLVQREKMASLGELTAGIAHEIQDPLNFVNNFSEVSKELIEELKDEQSRPEAERDKGLEDEILSDIESNLEKINHHGKRASNIVKGMLEHSRTSTGERNLVDINALCDEYLRLSYHGLRAKDKAFNADFKLEQDPNLPKIEAVSQDIGRVLLNLINNAFYAVNKRNTATVETLHATSLPSSQYKPMVIVSTKKIGNTIEISVQDNGGGIPENIKSKIFQPFFTTKPTGEGTGLGLSLSYDIITKGHGGTIELETKEGEGTTFVISLPIK